MFGLRRQPRAASKAPAEAFEMGRLSSAAGFETLELSPGICRALGVLNALQHDLRANGGQLHALPRPVLALAETQLRTMCDGTVLQYELHRLLARVSRANRGAAQHDPFTRRGVLHDKPGCEPERWARAGRSTERARPAPLTAAAAPTEPEPAQGFDDTQPYFPADFASTVPLALDDRERN